MSCMPSCMNRQQRYHQMINRNTSAPVKFDINQIEELRKKFNKIALYHHSINGESFKKNMGILGLHCAQQFSQRLFNSFDLDNDGQISFQDFIEYMQILKSGTDKHKARLSFKLIAPKKSNSITQQNFKQFLSDFFLSWSSITNVSITNQIKDRASQYVSLLFKKVKKQTGKQQIDTKYYVDTLYKDRDYMQSFEFITQGMANMFIYDQVGDQDGNPEFVLYKVLKEINRISDTVFQMNNQQSYQFQSVHLQVVPIQLPAFCPTFTMNKTQILGMQQQSRLQFNGMKEVYQSNRPKTNDEGAKRMKMFVSNEPSQTYQYTHTQSSPSNKQKQLYLDNASRLLFLQKKLNFIKEKLTHIMDDTKVMFATLSAKFQTKKEEASKNTKDAVRKNVHKRIKKEEGQMIFIGDDNWNLVLNMMIGIQMAVRSVKGFQQMIYQQPKDFDLKYYFQLIPRRFGNQQYNSTICSFTDYAPNIFNHIRKLFKIDNEDYIRSIGPNRLMASLMMGEVNSMTSLTSQGKSGSFFYYTADGKYMLKTIRYRQYKFLRTLLADYYYHLKKNPDSLITKFFGLHKLIQKNERNEQIARSYFIIMANVFNTKEKIVERYDIKGSWHGRTTTDKDPTATKKDNDFKERVPIYLVTEERNNILSIIKRDAAFFELHEIIDYSLLIGVIRRQQSDISSFRNINNESFIIREEQRQTYGNRESKIYLSSESCQTYIFGIIDILTLYDSRKVCEYYFKKLVYGDGISAVPPLQYGQRFLHFIEQKVFPKCPQQPPIKPHLQTHPSN